MLLVVLLLSHLGVARIKRRRDNLVQQRHVHRLGKIHELRTGSLHLFAKSSQTRPKNLLPLLLLLLLEKNAKRALTAACPVVPSKVLAGTETGGERGGGGVLGTYPDALRH